MMMMILILTIITVVTVVTTATLTLPNYYIRQNLYLAGGWSESNRTDARVLRISEWVVNSTFHHPYHFEILSVRQQVVAGINYDLLLKTYLNNTSPLSASSLSTILYNYGINFLHLEDSLALLSATHCWSKDRFIVWDHFGNLSLTNHSVIKRNC